MAEPDNALTVAILKELRTDSRKKLALLLQLNDAAQRHDRRFPEIDRRFGEIDHRFAEIDRRFGEIDRRFDEMGHRITESRDEIELMLKSELMGRLTHFETQMDERLAQLDDRISAQGKVRD